MAKIDPQRDGDPLEVAIAWQREAWELEPADANAAALATADAEGVPNVRMVLVKEITAGVGGGFTFYTNLGSAKGDEFAANPRAALVLHWKSNLRQLRVRGPVEPVGSAEADAYYASRPYQSRIGAWASRQSAPLASKAALLAAVARFTAEYPHSPPRPAHWSGFRLRPLEIEFWQNGAFRLHDRFRWRRPAIGEARWSCVRLYP